MEGCVGRPGEPNIGVAICIRCESDRNIRALADGIIVEHCNNCGSGSVLIRDIEGVVAKAQDVRGKLGTCY